MFAAAVGCRGGLLADSASTQSLNMPGQQAAQPSNSPAEPTDTPQVATDSASSDGAEMAEILTELIDVGALDEASKQRLLADLEEADPKNWPLIVQHFRTTLAFRKQLAAREQARSAETVAVAPQDEVVDHDHVRRPQTNRRDARRRAVPVSVDAREVDGALVANERDTRLVSHSDAEPLVVDRQQDERQHRIARSSKPLSAEPRPSDQPIVLTKPPMPSVERAGYNTSAQQTQDWQSDLQRAVLGMQAAVRPMPGSTNEVNQHMQLRLLQLLAGDQEAALQAIPGATASQQDYWNQQLFAVSTFLDSERQPDTMRRAAGSLTHLDQARTKLAELATLQVRSLAFVESVNGYGDYEPLEISKFRAGQEILLYAEIENFSSRSTKQGFRTRLGTSFEIVDKNGKRVDSAQFPEVEDLCKSARRDFHMQYTITLPTRIYPDEYEIRLIVTDEQSQKIGQASLPFEISE